jgi:23S rRNA (adenine-N6)-dimethyltransferase
MGVNAVEKDARLFAGMQRRFARHASVRVFNADFLTFRLPDEPYHIVSNIPFGITADIVRRVIGASEHPDTVTLILQREAAAKFAGVPRETVFSLLHKPRFSIEIVGAVPRSAFVPLPRVQCAVLSMRRRETPLVPGSESARYARFIETTLGHGSPMLAPGLRR